MKRLLLLLLLLLVSAEAHAGDLIKTPVRSLPTSPNVGETRIVTDGINSADCVTGGGDYGVLCTYDINQLWKAGGGIGDTVAAEVDTLATVVSRGNTVTTANSFNNSIKYLDSNGDGVAWYTDPTVGPVSVCVDNNVEGACTAYERRLLSGQTLGVLDNLGADIFRLTNNTKAVSFGGAVAVSGQINASNTGIEFTESDTNPTCAAGNYNIYADLSETTLKKCINGVSSVMVPAALVTDTYIVKAADETLNTNASAQDDNELIVPVSANSTYMITAMVLYNSPTTADFRYNFSLPAGASGYKSTSHAPLSTTACSDTSTTTINNSITSVDNNVGGAGAVCALRITGTVIVAGTAGNVTFQWAQATSDAGTTTVYANSWISYRKIP